MKKLKVSNIETGIPIPPIPKPTYKGGSKKKQFTINLQTMDVNESFVVSGAEGKTISGYISRMKKYNNNKYTSRKIGPEKYRVWRTK